MPLVDALGERARLGDVGRRGLAPQHVGVGRVGARPRDRALDAAVQGEEALGGALALDDELAVARVDVGHEELRAVGVGAGHEHGRHAAHVGGEPGGHEGPDERGRGDEDLASHVPALLLGGDLVLEVHAGGAGLDHRLHQLEGVERPAEAGLGVGHDRYEPLAARPALRVLDLVRALERAVDAAHHVRDAVGRVEALVGVGLRGVVRVGRDLPAREVDRVEAGADHLHRLVAGEGAERVHVGPGVEEVPQPQRAAAGERVLDAHGAAEPLHVLGRVGPGDPAPAPVGDVPRQVRGRGVLHEEVVDIVRPPPAVPSRAACR